MSSSNEEKEEKAAVVIQRTFRGYIVRKEMGEQKQAAVVIQKNYRGYKVRRNINLTQSQQMDARLAVNTIAGVNRIKPERKETSTFADVAAATVASVHWSKKKKKVIDKLHRQFETTVGIMLGINHSCSKYDDIDKDTKLTSDDINSAIKTIFPRNGSNDTPAHQLDEEFEFKDYAGKLFAKLRRINGIYVDEYLRSLAGNLPYLDFVTNSKSGEFFFFTHDRRYMIKTMPSSESKFFRSILASYHEHIVNYPDSFICRFFGLHRIRYQGDEVHFVVMNNVFPHDKQIHTKFDLKGSSVGRMATERESRQLAPVLKDLDFEGLTLCVGQKLDPLVEQIRVDSQWLASHNIMDYSMLLGIHFQERKEEKKEIEYAYQDIYQKQERPGETFAKSNPQLIEYAKKLAETKQNTLTVHNPVNHNTYDGVPRELSSTNLMEGPGLHSTNKTGEHAIYYMAIIDILQRYNIRKRIEHFLKGFKHNRHEISCVPPVTYAQRFTNFLKSHLSK